MQILTTDFRQTLERARPLLLELSSWHKNLQQGNSSSSSGNQTLDVPEFGPLKLSFHAAQFSIFRALLRTFDNSDINSHLEQSDMSEFEEARQHCRKAARTCTEVSLEFISSLNSKYFEQFWPPCKCFTLVQSRNSIV